MLLSHPPPRSPHLIGDADSLRLADVATAPAAPDRERDEDRLERAGERLRKLQRKLVADGRYAILFVFQGMDASGKDSAIRKVFGRVHPVGCHVHSFGPPTHAELQHDFMWRIWQRLPERGAIGVFNRSHYEDVVIARVHPELLEAQGLPRPTDESPLWNERLDAIRAFERHLAASGTAVLKFFLHLSPDEQRRRFLRRIDKPNKHWKFSSADARERRYWDDYQRAYQRALRATARPWAPWYAIPADDKPYARACIAEVCAEALGALDLRYPAPGRAEQRDMRALRAELERDAPGTRKDEND